MPDIPCPAQAQRARTLRGSSHRRALFLLNHQSRLSGAVSDGQILTPEQASALWQAYPWEPVTAQQPWPAMDVQCSTGVEKSGWEW